MMVKLQDFAREQGVTDRAIQKHLKKYADEFEGLFQRRGPNGTWLTEEACELLRSKMRLQPIILGDNQTVRDLEESRQQVAALQAEKADIARQLAALAQWKADKAMEIASAEQTRNQLAAAEKERLLLEGFVADAKAEIAVLSDEKATAEKKAKEALEAAERAQNALTAAHERETALAAYAAALAEYSSLGWFKKRRTPKPVAPDFKEDGNHEENHAE